MFNQLAALDTSRTTWKIKVRVTRMWPSISTKSDGKEILKGYNLILLDDNNCHVHAFVYGDDWKTLADKIEEGGLYVISNFYTKPNKQSLKPVSSKILINFSHSTSVEKLKDDDFMIPLHKFEFVDLADLFSVASAYVDVDFPEYAADIIGVIEDFEPVRKISTTYGERDIVKFRVTDGRHSSNVSVWGNLAVETNQSYKAVVERPIIVILTTTKLKIFKNSVQISTLPSSKVYLNLDNDIVIAMRQRLQEEGYIVPEQVTASSDHTIVASIIETLSLKELSEKISAEFIKKHFFCNVKVLNVEETNWWYNSCSDCQGEVEKHEGRFKCSTCPNKTIPVAEKRYRIVILGQDPTEAYNFILMDRAARRLLGMTATKMMANMLQSSSSFPPKIKELTGKEVQLIVEISEDNIKSNSRLYYASDAYDSSISTTAMSDATISGYGISAFAEHNVVELSDSTNTPCSKNTPGEISIPNEWMYLGVVPALRRWISTLMSGDSD